MKIWWDQSRINSTIVDYRLSHKTNTTANATPTANIPIANPSAPSLQRGVQHLFVKPSVLSELK